MQSNSKQAQAPAPIPFPYIGIPPTAYDEQKADKPTPISKPHFRELFRDWLVLTCIPSVFIRLAWIFYLTGSAQTHAIIMLTLQTGAFVTGLLVLLSVIPDSKIKLKGSVLRWVLMTCLGIVTSLLIHYSLFV